MPAGGAVSTPPPACWAQHQRPAPKPGHPWCTFVLVSGLQAVLAHVQVAVIAGIAHTSCCWGSLHDESGMACDEGGGQSTGAGGCSTAAAVAAAVAWPSSATRLIPSAARVRRTYAAAGGCPAATLGGPAANSPSSHSPGPSGTLAGSSRASALRKPPKTLAPPRSRPQGSRRRYRRRTSRSGQQQIRLGAQLAAQRPMPTVSQFHVPGAVPLCSRHVHRWAAEAWHASCDEGHWRGTCAHRHGKGRTGRHERLVEVGRAEG